MGKVKKQVSIREIAQLAGVSVSTVSKVMNNKADVGDETRLKILKIINEMNYNRKVSAVKGRTIAIFIGGSGDQEYLAPYSSSIVLSAANILMKENFRVELLPLAHLPKTEVDFASFFLESNIIGAIIVLSEYDDTQFGLFAKNIPMVFTSNLFKDSSVPTVNYDSFSACEMVTNYLQKLGHSRIGFICEDQDHYDQIMRTKAFREVMHNINPGYEPCEYLEAKEHDKEKLFTFIEESLFVEGKFNENGPTAFVISNDFVAAMVLDILSTLDISVPDMISIVGFDDLSFSAHLHPALTTVSQPTGKLGECAAKKIIEMIESPQLISSQQATILPGHLVIRDSAGPCPK